MSSYPNDLFNQEFKPEDVEELKPEKEKICWSCRICQKDSSWVSPKVLPENIMGFIDHPIKGMICLKCHTENRRKE